MRLVAANVGRGVFFFTEHRRYCGTWIPMVEPFSSAELRLKNTGLCCCKL